MDGDGYLSNRGVSLANSERLEELLQDEVVPEANTSIKSPCRIVVVVCWLVRWFGFSVDDDVCRYTQLSFACLQLSYTMCL